MAEDEASRFGGDARDSTRTQAARELIEDIQGDRKEFAQESELQPADKGGLMGLALGIKPAVEIEGKLMNSEALLSALKRTGIDVVAVGTLIVNPKAVENRISQEPELAKTVNWDPSAPVEEFIRKNDLARKPTGQEATQWHAQRGFLMGLPRTAIETTRRASDIARSEGVKWLSQVADIENQRRQGEQTYRAAYADKLTGEEMEFMLYQDRVFVYTNTLS